MTANTHPPRSTSWPAMLMLFLAGVLASAQLGRVTPLVEQIRADLGITLTEVSWLVSLITLIGAATGAGIGAVIARFGEKRAIACGLAVLALGVLVAVLGRNYATMVGARVIEGIGYLLLVVAAPSLMTNASDERDRAKVMAIWSTFIPVGLTIAAILNLQFAGVFPWRGMFALHGGLILVLGLVVWSVIRRLEGPARTEPRPAETKTRRGSLPGLVLAMGFSGFAGLLLAFLSLYPAFIRDEYGAVELSGFLVLVISAAGIPGSLLTGWLIGRGWSQRGLLRGAMLAAALVLFLAYALQPGLAAITVAGLAVGLLYGVVPAIVFSAIKTVAADAVDVIHINGYIAQLGCIGSLLGPPLFAWVVETAGWAYASIPLAVLSIATVLLVDTAMTMSESRATMERRVT